jgi:transposase-like protein
MRKPHRVLDQVAALQTEGLPQAGIARIQRVSPSTVSRWLERVSTHARAFEAEHLEMRDPAEIQLDEIKAYGAGRYDSTWVYNALEVSSRLWMTSEVDRRTLRATKRFITSVREACAPGGPPPLVTSDEFKYYEPVMRRAFGPTVVYVQVDNRYKRDRIVRTRSRLVIGTEWKFEAALDRCEDSNRPNTSYIERLNLFIRFACSYLRRRTPARMRKPQKLRDAIDLLRCYYNFIRPHSSLKFGPVTRTPAMQAELTNKPLTWREIFRWVPPPKPGLKRRKVALGW